MDVPCSGAQFLLPKLRREKEIAKDITGEGK